LVTSQWQYSRPRQPGTWAETLGRGSAVLVLYFVAAFVANLLLLVLLLAFEVVGCARLPQFGRLVSQIATTASGHIGRLLRVDLRRPVGGHNSTSAVARSRVLLRRNAVRWRDVQAARCSGNASAAPEK